MSSFSSCLTIMDLCIEGAADEMPAVMSWQRFCCLSEALCSDLKWTKTEEHLGGWWGVSGKADGECWCDGLVETCFNFIVMILASLNSPEERVFFHVELHGNQENLIRSTVCVSGQSGLSFLRDYSSLLCKTVWPCAVRERVWLDITLCNCDVIVCPVRPVLVDHEYILNTGSSLKDLL